MNVFHVETASSELKYVQGKLFVKISSLFGFARNFAHEFENALGLEIGDINVQLLILCWWDPVELYVVDMCWIATVWCQVESCFIKKFYWGLVAIFEGLHIIKIYF